MSHNERHKALGTLIIGLVLIVVTFGVVQPIYSAEGSALDKIKAAHDAGTVTWILVAISAAFLQQHLLTLLVEKEPVE
ncbi:hypothetical protein [Tropicimonas sp.]|uniref:hypothetical protein n=1 Tax=Tropicimonas sp. TaxID=2067044 RepID=UPI003A864305